MNRELRDHPCPIKVCQNIIKLLNNYTDKLNGNDGKISIIGDHYSEMSRIGSIKTEDATKHEIVLPSRKTKWVSKITE